MKKNKMFLAFVISTLLGSLSFSQSEKPVASPATTPKQASNASVDATKAFKPKFKPIPSHFKINEISQSASELQEISKERYDVWFSPSTKLAVEYPYKKAFMSWPRIYDIDRNQMPACKKQFNELCGTEDYPLAEKFIFCLQDKFDQYKSNQSCATAGHYLVHINFHRYLTYNTEPCKTILDKCAKVPNSSLLPWQCALGDNETPPLCKKLINDFLRLRVLASKIYDKRLICPPGGCK